MTLGPATRTYRIAALTHARGWSGGCAQMIQLCRDLSAREHEIFLLCPLDGETARKGAEAGLHVYPFSARQDYDLAAAWRLARFVREFEIDLVHAHHPKAHAIALLAKWLYPAFKLVVSRRVSFEIPRHPFSRIKYTHPAVDSYVAVSRYVSEVLQRAGIGPERIRVIPSGVDTSRFHPQEVSESLKSRWGLPAGVPLIGKVANWSEWKGQAVFLRAARRLREKGHPAHFVLAGRDTDGTSATRMIREMGLADCVHLLGFQEDVPEILACLDVSVNSSVKGEGLSGVIRESLSMGIPVVASDVGGNRELVRPGETGELFPSGDDETLARHLMEALKQPERFKRMAGKGRELVLHGYTQQRHTQRTLELYRELLTPRKILVIQMKRMGDALLTLPALEALKKSHPHAQIDFLVEASISDLFENHPAVNRLLRYASGKHVRWIRAIRRERYDWVLDYLGTGRTAWLCYFSGAALRVGSGKTFWRFLYHRRFPPLGSVRYVGEERIEVLKRLRLVDDSVPPDRFRFFLSEAKRDEARSGLKALGLDFSLPIVAFLPHSRRPTRRWPENYYARLAEMLQQDWRAQTLLFWGPGERTGAERILRQVSTPACYLAPETAHPMDLAACLSFCRMAVTNCNGPKHVAVALGIPTLTLHGSSDPRAWNPPENSAHRVLRTENLGCIGCRLNECPYHLECMQWLTPEKVWSYIQEHYGAVNR